MSENKLILKREFFYFGFPFVAHFDPSNSVLLKVTETRYDLATRSVKLPTSHPAFKYALSIFQLKKL